VAEVAKKTTAQQKNTYKPIHAIKIRNSNRRTLSKIKGTLN
jgi:hypothetical protein